MSRLLLKKVFIVLSLILLVQPLYADEKPMVFVSIPPQKYFIEQITKDKIDIQVMVPHGKNPYNYQPTDKQMDDLLKAKLYFSIGALFEKKWLETIVNHNPELEIIHTDDTIEKAPETLNFYENGIEQKIAKYQAENGRIDYHTWLSPALIRPQIRFILSALYMIDPKNELTYETNSRQFLVELITLYKEIKQTLSGMEGNWIKVYSFFDQNYKSKIADTLFKSPKKVKFLKYTIEKLEVSPDGDKAEVIIKSDIEVNDFLIKNTFDNQKWIFENGNWFHSAKPVIGFTD